jgi:DNA end-binding protein Ku
MEYAVAPRAYWKGYLKLSLVSCPVALFPASSGERKSASIRSIKNRQPHQIPQSRCRDRRRGRFIRHLKGYEVGKGQYIEIQPEELEAIAIESTRTIEIDEFVPKSLSENIRRDYRVFGA